MLTKTIAGYFFLIVALMAMAPVLTSAPGLRDESRPAAQADETSTASEEHFSAEQDRMDDTARDDGHVGVQSAGAATETRQTTQAIISFWRRRGSDIARATHEHLFLVFVSLVMAIVIALPLGIFLSHCGNAHIIRAILGFTGIIQTVPALALIAFIMVLFAALNLPPIGQPPALFALVLYALLPILRNTYTSINQVDPAVKEVATGLGMRPIQVLFRVELPIALPVIMAGIRISSVWTIGIATLCGLIAAGGLGRIIFIGISTVDTPLIIMGTIPAAMMALVSEWILGGLERWLTPEGLRIASQEQ